MKTNNSVEELIKLAIDKAGFEHAGKMDVSKIELLSSVRDMCNADKCNMYGKTWTCPPACGTIEECKEKLREYKEGVLVQTVGQMEDEFDFETMMETEKKHKERFMYLNEITDEWEKLSLSAGACKLCENCTYPYSPCRFPEKAMVSMEAFGMFVSEECKKAGMKYNYGKNTICFSSCILLKWYN